MTNSKQPKPFALPLQLVSALESFAPADRGEAYSLIFNYIYYRQEPSEDCSPAARGAFELAMIILAPELAKLEESELASIQKKREESKDILIKKTEPVRPLLNAENRKTFAFKLLNLYKTPRINDVVDVLKPYCNNEKLLKRLLRAEYLRRYPDNDFNEFYKGIKEAGPEGPTRRA